MDDLLDITSALSGVQNQNRNKVREEPMGRESRRNKSEEFARSTGYKKPGIISSYPKPKPKQMDAFTMAIMKAVAFSERRKISFKVEE